MGVAGSGGGEHTSAWRRGSTGVGAQMGCADGERGVTVPFVTTIYMRSSLFALSASGVPPPCSSLVL